MTQPFNLLSQKGYSTIGRQRHHTSFGEICEWYETGDSDLPGSRKLASPRCLHIGPVANRGFTISQPLPHLKNNCKCFRRRYLSILTRAPERAWRAPERGPTEFQLWPIKCELNSLMSQFNEPASLGQNLSRIQSSILLHAGHAISLLTSKTCRSILRVGHVRLKQTHQSIRNWQ